MRARLLRLLLDECDGSQHPVKLNRYKTIIFTCVTWLLDDDTTFPQEGQHTRGVSSICFWAAPTTTVFSSIWNVRFLASSLNFDALKQVLCKYVTFHPGTCPVGKMRKNEANDQNTGNRKKDCFLGPWQLMGLGWVSENLERRNLQNI